MMWRTLPWLPGYEISEAGDVRRTVAARTRPKGSILTGKLTGKYRRVQVALPDGSSRSFGIHRLVCEAFHGPEPEGRPEVAHGDGNRANNHFTNLRWATSKENHADRRQHGTDGAGERNSRAILTWPDVHEIRRRFDGTGKHIVELAAEYGLSVGGMAGICRGRRWRDGLLASLAPRRSA